MKRTNRISKTLRWVTAIAGIAILAQTSLANVVALYEAGADGVPDAAPDPTSAEGGAWGLVDSTDGNPDFANEGVAPDSPFPYNAWRVLDNSTAGGQFIYYYKALEEMDVQAALNNGWKISVFLRVADPVADNAGFDVPFFMFGYGNNRRYIVFFTVTEENGLNVRFNQGATHHIEDPEQALGYNLIELEYDPGTERVTCSVNGEVVLTDWNGQTGNPQSYASFGGHLEWGASSSGGRGDGYFNRVQMEVSDPPPAPVVVEHPESATREVGDSVTFTAAFDGLVTSYQWYKDGVPIPDAESSTYTIGFITPEDQGSYHLEGSNVSGSAVTDAAFLEVLADSAPPQITGASASIWASRVRLQFDEPVDAVTAGDPANYVFSESALDVSWVTILNEFTVELNTFPAPAPGADYLLFVSNVEDLSGNAIEPNTAINISVVGGIPSAENLIVALTPESITPASPDGAVWMDASGNENHAVSRDPEPDRRPTLFTAGAKGQTMGFDPAAQQRLAIDGPASTGLDQDPASYSWFAVLKVTNIAQGLFPNVIRHQTSINAANWGSFFFNGSDALSEGQQAIVANGRNANLGAVEAVAFPAANGVWCIVSGQAEDFGMSGRVWSRITFPDEGVSHGATNNFDGPMSFGTIPVATWIGATAGGGNSYFGGEMAEVLLFTGLMDADHEEIEDYLKAKYFPDLPALQVQLVDGTIEVHFTGTLQSSPDVHGPYTDVPDSPASPYVVPVVNAASQQFFRSKFE